MKKLSLPTLAAALTLISVAPVAAQQVLAANSQAITIEHTKFMRGKAVTDATVHCSKHGKVAVLVNRQKSGFPKYISSFICQ